MVVAITGITGLLGRNILFELLRQHRQRLQELKVFAFGKAQGGKSLQARILDMMREDGAYYLGTADISPFADRVTAIGWQLEEEGLGISSEDMEMLRRTPIGLFIHAAATVDFRDSPNVRDALQRVNVTGTARVAALCEKLQIGQFAFISTAYACGMEEGVILPGTTNFEAGFRNPYERSKLEAEVLVREFWSKGKLPQIKIFRPSTICGRLLEPLPGQTNKFDIFYAWLAFFLRLKAKKLGHPGYGEFADIDIRVCFNPNGGLNIIPADYAAKALLQVCRSGTAEQDFHLVSPKESPNQMGIPLMFDFIKVALPPFQDSVPEQLSPLERLYYEKSVGRIYTPYITSNTMDFRVDSLLGNLPEGFPECPFVGPSQFVTLLEFARKHNFGIS